VAQEQVWEAGLQIGDSDEQHSQNKTPSFDVAVAAKKTIKTQRKSSGENDSMQETQPPGKSARRRHLDTDARLEIVVG
jgi:hypothetical protein